MFFMSLSVLDAGHGGANPGATYNGRKESEDALALTLAVGSVLEENGVECVLHPDHRYLRVSLSEGTGGK